MGGRYMVRLRLPFVCCVKVVIVGIVYIVVDNVCPPNDLVVCRIDAEVVAEVTVEVLETPVSSVTVFVGRMVRYEVIVILEVGYIDRSGATADIEMMAPLASHLSAVSGGVCLLRALISGSWRVV
jgi:hypothetical protein